MSFAPKALGKRPQLGVASALPISWSRRAFHDNSRAVSEDGGSNSAKVLQFCGFSLAMGRVGAWPRHLAHQKKSFL